jgi:anti-sigma factor RsiW
MECQQSQSLIPSYLDGELSEAQAAPLRRHLLDCQPCRAGAQSEKNLKRWFSASIPVSVPRGFAARIARRAFAGDTGEPPVELVPVVAASFGAVLGSSPRPTSERDVRRGASEDQLLRFILQVTAAAALVVIALSVALRSLSLPSGTSLRAADGRNEIGVEQALERLDRLNRVERFDSAGARGAPTSAKHAPEGTTPESTTKASGDSRP